MDRRKNQVNTAHVATAVHLPANVVHHPERTTHPPSRVRRSRYRCKQSRSHHRPPIPSSRTLFLYCGSWQWNNFIVELHQFVFHDLQPSSSRRCVSRQRADGRALMDHFRQLVVPRESYTVLRLITNDPGVWPFHCHIGWHLAYASYTLLSSL